MDILYYIYSMKARFFKFFKGKKEDLYCNGIYKISFGSKNCYIGSTTVTFKDRFSKHYNSLCKITHCNNSLTNSFKKYKGKITFEIVEIIKDADLNNILIREQYWIDFYNSYHKGYNEVQFAGHTTGFKMPEKIVEKKRKKYLQYNLEGDFIKEWDSYTAICKEIGAFPSNKILDSSRYKAFNSLWRRKVANNFTLKIEPYSPKYKHKILQYNLEGNFIREFESILDASNYTKINAGNIIRALKNNINESYNYLWKYHKENYPLKIDKYIKQTGNQKFIEVTDITNNKIFVCKSTREVQKLTGLARENFMKKLGKVIKKKNENKKYIIKKINKSEYEKLDK